MNTSLGQANALAAAFFLAFVLVTIPLAFAVAFFLAFVLVTIPLAFAVGTLVSRLFPEPLAAARFAEMQRRVHLGPEPTAGDASS